MADENAFPLERAVLIVRDAISGALSTLQATAGSSHVYEMGMMAGERGLSTDGNDHVLTRTDWNLTVVTGVTTDVVVSPAPAHLAAVRVAGVAPLVGAVQIRDSATLLETIPAGSAIGVERGYYGGGRCANNLTIKLASAADTVLIFWRPV